MTKKNTSAFKNYFGDIKNHFTSGDATEHTYRPALESFIKSFGPSFKVTNEPGQRGKVSSKNKPDFVVMKGHVPLGYIETKDVNTNLDKTANSDQIRRYCEAYPNLIVTDYLEFRRYVKGELRASVRIAKASKKGISLLEFGEEDLKSFFEDFLVEETFSISTAQELAMRLASLTKQIRKMVKKELDTESDSARLHMLMKAFKKVLISDLDEDQFSDMFAQTLAYGFFAAKVHFDGKGEFSRRTASNILPKTNPFLRKLFREFADENMPDSIVGAVDEIVDLLKKTDIQKVLQEFGSQGKNDAVIHFYESFLGAFDPQLKKEMGVFYTPDAVVDYMVRSLDEILVQKFGRRKGLADEKTLLLDPALGTGSYLHKIVDVIHSKVQKGSWDSYVSESLLDRIFGFEILMAPYAVAHLNLGLQLHKKGYDFEKDQRLGVFLTNTLEETAKRSEVLFEDWISEEANAAASIKRDKPIMVVVGNPPYAAESQNDGDWIRGLMRGYDSLSDKKCANYFECEGQPLGEKNPKALNDDYVKFMRFAHWRIEQTGHGVLAFITNHGYLDNPTFRGMREQLMSDFDDLYLLDLHGSTRRANKGDGSKDENVFNIQTGVSIAFFVRADNKNRKQGAKANVYRADLTGTRNEKFKWLHENSWETTKFEKVTPEAPSFVFKKQNKKMLKEFELGVKVTEIFPVYSEGIKSARDGLTIDARKETLWNRVKDFSSMGPEEAREKFDLGKDATDWQVKLAQADLKRSKVNKENIVPISYRPFDSRWIYYSPSPRGFLCRPREKVMTHMTSGKNIGLCFSRPMSPKFEFSVFCTRGVIDQCVIGNKSGGAGGSSLAPLFLMDGKLKRPNISQAVLEKAEGLCKNKSEAPEMFFNYAYAILNSETYKKQYGEALKADYPRVQITDDKALFQKLSILGSELTGVHTMEDDRIEGSKVVFPVKGSNEIESVRFSPDESRVYINDKQYFENIDTSLWSNEFGGYKVLEKWLKDRKGESLVHSEIEYYEQICGSIELHAKVVDKIDKVIAAYGGWPLAKEIPLKKKAA